MSTNRQVVTIILRGPKKLEETGRQHESWRFNIARILQTYEKILLKATNREMEGTVDLAQE